MLIAERSIGGEPPYCCDDPIMCMSSQFTNLALGSSIQPATSKEVKQVIL
jgi:hypothetical protein